LRDGVSRDEVDEKEDEAYDQPYDGQSIEDALEEAGEHSCQLPVASCRFSVLSSQFSVSSQFSANAQPQRLKAQIKSNRERHD
jgi:hypothetical protein